MASPLAASVSRLRDGRLVAVNDAWLALTGLTREAALGRTTVELGHWPDEAARQAYVNAIKGDQHETLWLCEGVAHHVRLHSQVLRVLPEPLLLVYLTEATTEVAAEQARQQTEQALRDANLALQQRVELHEAVERVATVGHWTNAESEQEVYWSDGLYEIAGLQRQDRLTRALGRGGIHPDDMDAWLQARQHLDHLRQSGEPQTLDLVLRRADGGLFHARLLSVAVFDAQGHFTHCSSTVTPAISRSARCKPSSSIPTSRI